jgi:hypothetical protein
LRAALGLRRNRSAVTGALPQPSMNSLILVRQFLEPSRNLMLHWRIG